MLVVCLSRIEALDQFNLRHDRAGEHFSVVQRLDVLFRNRLLIVVSVENLGTVQAPSIPFLRFCACVTVLDSVFTSTRPMADTSLSPEI